MHKDKCEVGGSKQRNCVCFYFGIYAVVMSRLGGISAEFHINLSLGSETARNADRRTQNMSNEC